MPGADRSPYFNSLVEAVLAQLQEGVIITDQHGRIIFVNEAAKRIHGVARLDVTPDDYSDMYHLFTEDGEPYPPEELPLTRAVRLGEAVIEQRWRIRRADGVEVLAIGNATPVYASDGAQIGSVLTIRDDTKRRASELALARSEQRLQDSETRFRTMADNIAQLAWMAHGNGDLFWYNKRWYEYTGTKFEEMAGWGWRSVHDPAHVDRVVETFSRSLLSGEPWEDTFPLRDARGNYRWFLSRALPIRDADGAIALWFGTNTDITELRAAEEALRASETRFRNTFENAGVGMAHVGLDGRWLLVNDRLCDIVGRSRWDILGGRLQDITHPDDFAADAERRAQILEGVIDTSSAEMRIKRPDGPYVWVATTASLQRDAAGTPHSFIVAVQDITIEKAAVEHQQFLMRELSHRTKNLLAVIQAISRQTARGSTSKDDFNSRFTSRLGALASSHDLLVNQNWSGAKVREMVNEQLKPFVALNDARVHLDGPDVLVTATAAQALGLALHELATNAAKYGALSVPAGALHVTWRVVLDSGGQRRFTMRWVERNGPPVQPVQRKGFGHVVIEQMVAASLFGSATLTLEATGAEWTLDAPATCLSTLAGAGAS